MAHRFLLPPGTLRPGPLTLPAEEGEHAARALRLRPGESIELGDGAGWTAAARILATNREVTAEAQAPEFTPAPTPRLVLGTAIPKGKRWQVLVEKCTELGVSVLRPLIFERSVAEGAGDPERWRRWAAEAAKQCRRAWLPEIAPPVELETFLAEAATGPCLLADPEGDPLLLWGGQLDRAAEVRLLIGPEGGLTETEIDLCRRAVYAPVRLGAHILRIETAAIAAVGLTRALVAGGGGSAP